MYVDVVLAAFAVWQIVEVWHHGEIFAGRRAVLELWDSGFLGWLADLLLCPWCTSVWVGFVAGACAWAGGWFTLPLYMFAVSRLANLLNDITHSFTRTGNRFKHESIPDVPGCNFQDTTDV